MGFLWPRPAFALEFLCPPAHPRRIAPPVAESGMPDLLMLGLAALLFGGALLYVFVCERL